MYGMGILYVPGAQGSTKKTSDPLELELNMAVSHHVGSGN